MRMRRQKIFTNLKVESLWYGGVGIATLESGKKMLIKWALPGSEVDVRVVKKRRDYMTAHIIKVHSVDNKWLDGDLKCPHHLSPYKVQSDIHQAKTWCGWCKWQVVSYEKQCLLKDEIIQSCFPGVKNPDLVKNAHIIPSPEVFWYRNKIEFSFWKYLKKYPKDEEGNQKEGFEIAQHWQMWFHKQGEFSKVVDIDKCYLVSEKMHKIFHRIKAFLQDSGLPVHDAKSHTWLFRHLMIREGIHTDHILVNLSIASKHFEKNQKDYSVRQETLKALKQNGELQEGITTFVLSENNGLADIMRDADTTHEVLRWEGKIYEELHFPQEGKEDVVLRFSISPASFFQTNTHGAQVLFQQAATMLWPVQGNIIDLYCGGGSIGQCFRALGMGKKVKWIEIVEAAVRDAQFNAKINHMSEHCDYYAGKAEKLLKEGTIDGGFFIWGDAIIVDPPREGMHPDVIKFLREMKQKHGFRLCYISCNPTTMARDIELLEEDSIFEMVQFDSVDMFPHTHHIECIWILE